MVMRAVGSTVAGTLSLRMEHSKTHRCKRDRTCANHLRITKALRHLRGARAFILLQCINVTYGAPPPGLGCHDTPMVLTALNHKVCDFPARTHSLRNYSTKLVISPHIALITSLRHRAYDSLPSDCYSQDSLTRIEISSHAILIRSTSSQSLWVS